MTGPAEPLIHAAVARWAARDPEATTLIRGEREISYGMLDAAADDIVRMSRPAVRSRTAARR